MAMTAEQQRIIAAVKARREAAASGQGMTAEQQRIIAAVKARREAASRHYSAGDKADAVARGAVDTVTFGTTDELAGLVGGGVDWVRGKLGEEGRTFSGGYKRVRDKAREIDADQSENLRGYRVAGQVAGALTGGVGLARGGLSLATNAARAGAGLGRVSGASALEGGLYGLAHGAGSGTDANSRMRGALASGAIGLGVGAVAPIGVAVGAGLGRTIVAPFMARYRPVPYANAALGTAVTRSGGAINDIVNQMDDAHRAGQGGVYTVADAMGNSGQRMLTAATRTPNNARQGATEFLQGRQAGQGRRIVNALEEGFDAPVTAAQRGAGLKASRNAAADIGYDAARTQDGMVNVSDAIASIDEVLRPGVSGVLGHNSTLANDTIEAALTKARAWLGNGREQLVGFNEVLRVKEDIDDMIGAAINANAGNKARLLIQVRNRIDAALEASSVPYAGARDAFRQGSREMEAVDTGMAAGAGRGRPEDNIDTFGRLKTPQEQSAFRVGYADPLIRDAQIAATGVNKARPLINDGTAAEFPAFAAPGRGDTLVQRLAREQQMSETAGAALGGSRTADNISDIIDMGNFDPSVWSNLLAGNLPKAAANAIIRVVQESRGLQPAVIERVARVLLETRPDVARQLLTAAMSQATMNAGMRGLVDAIINNSAGAISGRITAR